MAYPLAKQPLPEELPLTARRDGCGNAQIAMAHWRNTRLVWHWIYAYDGFLLSQSLRYLYVTRDTSREEVSISNHFQQLLGGPMPLLEHYPYLAILRGRT
jgi:hypothetical protein